MTHNKPCTTMAQHLAHVRKEESTMGTRTQNVQTNTQGIMWPHVYSSHSRQRARPWKPARLRALIPDLNGTLASSQNLLSWTHLLHSHT